uniref:Alpha-2-macroglobulin domain-containing protein n=2 Tax=Strongyloides stercoralis TaxID=6248 RepID=A0AAF5CRJ5_STRER
MNINECIVKVINGIKTNVVNLKNIANSCEKGKRGKSIQLKGIFTELSSGNFIEKVVDVDIMKKNFDIILVKPFVTKKTKKLYFILKNNYPLYDTGQINISIHCFNENTFNNITINSFNNKYSNKSYINLQNIENCEMLLVEGRSAKMQSIIKILVPILNSNEIIKSFLLPAIYQFEENVEFIVENNEKNLNYIIINQHNRIITFGPVTNNIINIKITSDMVGTNYLIVLSTTNTNVIDIVLFFGNNLCQNTNYSIYIKKNFLFFNDTLEGNIKGPNNGLALLKVYDKRLKFFENHNENSDEYWNLEKLLDINEKDLYKDTLYFQTQEMEGDTIRNLKPINNFFNNISKICKIIDVFYLKVNLNKYRNSSFWISNICIQYISKGIVERNKIKYGSILPNRRSQFLIRNKSNSWSSDIFRNNYNISDDDSEDDFKNEIKNSEIRDYFPEVWVFEDFILDEDGYASFKYTPPDSITSWIVDADFWKPQTTYTCPIINTQELEYRKDFFIEINLPSTIKALEVVDITVTVHSLSNTTFDNLYICMDKGTTNSCQNRGRDGSLADNSHFSLKSNTINNMATKKFEVIFFEENNNEIISFSLRRHMEDEEIFACESDDIYDIVKKSIVVLPDIRMSFKSTFFIINPDKKSELFNEDNEFNNDKNFFILETRDNITNELITNVTIIPSKDEVVGNLMVTLSEPKIYHISDSNVIRRKRDISSKYDDTHIYWIMSDLSYIFYKKLKYDFITEFVVKENLSKELHSNVNYFNELWSKLIYLKKYIVECDTYNFFADTIDNVNKLKNCHIEDAIKGNNIWITMLNTMMICDSYEISTKEYNGEELFFNINKLMNFFKISMEKVNLIKNISLPFDVEEGDKKFILYGIYLHVLNSCKLNNISKTEEEIKKIFLQFEDRDKEDILSTLFYISSSKRGKDLGRTFAWNDILFCFNANFKKLPWIQEVNDECKLIFKGTQKYITNPDTNMLINLLSLFAITNNFSLPLNYPNVSLSELQDYTLMSRNKRSETNLANEVFLEQESYKYVIFDMNKRKFNNKKIINMIIECVPSCYSITQEEYISDSRSKVIHIPPQTKTILFKSKGNGKKVVLVEGNMLTKINALKNDYPLKIEVQMYSEVNDLTHVITVKNLSKQKLDMIQFEHGLYNAGYELILNDEGEYIKFEDKNNIQYMTKPYRTDNSVVFLIGPIPINKDIISYNLTQRAIKAEANDIKLMGVKIILRHPTKGILGKIIVDNRTGFLKNKGGTKEKDSDIEYLCLPNTKQCFCGEGTSTDICKLEMTDRIKRSFYKDLNDTKKFFLVGVVVNISTVKENNDYKNFTMKLKVQSTRFSFNNIFSVFIRTTNNSNVKCMSILNNDVVLLTGNVKSAKNHQSIYHMSGGDVLVKLKETEIISSLIGKMVINES